MQLEKLILDLRPRSNAQALDLGMALLRACGRQTYASWLALWGTLVTVTLVLQWVFPSASGWLFLLPWWLKPALERAPLYVLSRAVFGETVSWQQAVRAWPRQLGGGMIYLLTLGRLLMPARGLYHPVWMLEGARGKASRGRRDILSRENTGSSAQWFAIICAHFEAVLQIGLLTLIGLFLTSDDAVNPWKWLFNPAFRGTQDSLQPFISTLAIGVSGAIMGPVYVACCFTLYLNRRARLEAWDIEIMLRQLAASRQSHAGLLRPLAALLLPLVVVCSLALPAQPAWADKPAAEPTCTPQGQLILPADTRKVHHPQQARLRQEVRDVFQHEDLRRLRCIEIWVPKPKKDEPEKKSKPADWPSWLSYLFGASPPLEGLAFLFKIVAIGILITAVVLMLYRYRHQLPRPTFRRRPRGATEVGGLDIRPESLPDDVTATVRRLWQEGEKREALALLYRATLSRLVQQDGLRIPPGATEGDCVRQTQLAAPHRLEQVRLLTELWLKAAWAAQWPDTDEVERCCQSWAAQFDGRTA